jgi:S1-C subfamily serine protease
MMPMRTMPAAILPLLLLLGCARPPAPARPPEAAAFHLQVSLEEATGKWSESVVYVEITANPSSQPRFPAQQTAGSQACTGIVLKEDGTILAPVPIDPDRTKRIEVWKGEERFKGRLLNREPALGISLVKIEPDRPLVPIDLEPGEDPPVGSWLVALSAYGPTADFRKYPDAGLFRGMVFGKYDQLSISGMQGARQMPGSPVATLEGKVTGLVVSGGAVIALRDLKWDLDRLLAHADAPLEPDASQEEDRNRPWLGVHLDPINPDYAEAMKLPKGAVWIQNVVSDSPAARAGLRAEDLVTAVDGTPIAFQKELALQHFQKLLRPEFEREVSLTILRDGTPMTFACTFGKKPEAREYQTEDLGVVVQETTESDYYERGLAQKEGVLVTQVIPGSPAARGNSMQQQPIQPDDLLIELDRRPIRNLDDFTRALEGIRGNNASVVLVKLYRNNFLTHVALNLKLSK